MKQHIYLEITKTKLELNLKKVSIANSNRAEITKIQKELITTKNFFLRVVNLIPSFHITNPKILPYGLKPHTRSVSWIIEQVIVQQAKYNRKKLGVSDVDFNFPDTSLHDCILYKKQKKYFINIKVTSAGSKQNKNDIAAVEKLYMQYSLNKFYRLVYVVFQFQFDNTKITFIKDKVHAFSPQFLPIYVNPRNDKMQAYYYAQPEFRSRKSFLNLLQKNSSSIVLP